MGIRESLAWSYMIVTSIILISGEAYAQESPFIVKWKFDDVTEIKKLEFTVTVERLTISDVIVNKGNCQIATNFNGAIELKVNDAVQQLGTVLSSRPVEKLPQKTDPRTGFPLTGAFGESLGVFVANSCNILLVETKTDQGDWTTKFAPK